MKTKVKHTPGPWRICYDGRIDGLNGDEICSGLGFESYKEFQDDKEAQANARLIAAAPDLLEALKMLQKATISLMGEAVDRKAADWGLVNDAMVDATKAIARAEVKEIK